MTTASGIANEAATTSYACDAAGNETGVTDARGATTTRTFEAGGRVLTTTVGFSRVAAETTTFTRDYLDRLTATTDAENNTESYSLDAFGSRLTVKNRLSGTTANAFDRRGQRLSETFDTNNVTNTYNYDARGHPLNSIEAYGLPEQRMTTYAYDLDDRLTSKTGDSVIVLAANHGGIAPVANVEGYQYDGRGDRTATTDANGATTYNYFDHLGRRITAVTPVGTPTTSSPSPAPARRRALC